MRNANTSKSQRGYTLVEISIALVIIGLLIGGTLAGRSIIRSAELRSVLEEKEQYVSAINQFRTRFQYWPGDFPTASNYFGLSRHCGGTSDLATASCNGNGSGSIDMSHYIIVAAPYNEEPFYVWRHLFAAGLVNVSYTGVQGDAVNDAIAGVNVPASKMDPGMWTIGNMYTPTSGVIAFNGSYGHTLILASESANPAGLGFGGVITSQEAYSLDTKIDNGMPATGNLRTFPGTMSPNCVMKADLSATAVDADLDAVYKIGKNDPDSTSSELSCALLFPEIIK